MTVKTKTRSVRWMIVAAFAAAAASCSGDSSSAGGSSRSGNDGSTTTSYATTWETVVAPDNCMCGDGSQWSYFVREADPTKVLIYLEGGGACFNAEMCATTSGAYKTEVGAGPQGGEGIFDLGNATNPLADYTMVFLPYCTGDVHSGDLTKDYGDGVVVEHKGRVNARTALEATAARFPAVRNLLIAGSSAGAFPTPIFAGDAADLMPDARVRVIADGGGAIPEAISVIVSNWGTLAALPAWPELSGVTAQTFTPTFSFVATARHNPSIAFARFDYAFDVVLADYARMAGLTPGDLMPMMRTSEQTIEETGVPVAVWIGPGSRHTILTQDVLYEEEMNDVRFVDWLTSFVEGESPADQYCTDCTG